MKKNKKGFTLTELIVVIVIIGILAAVLIPTLTGYINRAKESAAEQEATNYITAYTAWQLETPADEQDLDSFQAYCVDLELVSETEAETIILNVSTNKDNKSFTIKASNGLYVTYLNGDFKVENESPIYLLRDSFNETVIKNNLAEINQMFISGGSKIAELSISEINEDGSVNVNVSIIDKNAEPESVIKPVTAAIDKIKAGGGVSVYATPMINGVEYTAFKERVIELMGEEDSKGYFPVDLELTGTEGVAMWIAYTMVFNENYTLNKWSTAMTTLISEGAVLGDLLKDDKNDVKVVAQINDSNGVYDVIYYFNFVEGTNN